MKNLWSLDIPGLPLRAFQPRLGGMTLHAGVDSDFSGFDSGASNASTGSDPVNDPFSYYDPNTGGYTAGSPVSTSTEGDLGAAVFEALDKLDAGIPLNVDDLRTLSYAGLGSIEVNGGGTVDSKLSDIYSSIIAGFNIPYDPIVEPYEPNVGAQPTTTPSADPVKAALYGDVSYGTSMSGGSTRAFDDVLSLTGDVGRALSVAWSIENGVAELGGYIVNPDRTLTDPKSGLTYPATALEAKYSRIGGADQFIGYELAKDAVPIKSEVEIQYERDQQAIRDQQVIQDRIKEEDQQAEINYQEQLQKDLAAAQAAEEARRPVTQEDIELLPPEVVARAQTPAKRALDPAEEAYLSAYTAAISAGASAADARAAGDRAYDTFVNDISIGTSSGVAQEISPPDLSGRMPDTLDDFVSEVAFRAYDEAYNAAAGRGASHVQANAAGQQAMLSVFRGAVGSSTVSPGEREETDVGYVGGPLDQLGDVSSLEVEQNPFDTGRGPDVSGLDVSRPAYEVERGETSGLSSADRAALNTGEGYGTGFGSAEERERAQLSQEIDRLVPTDVSSPDRTVAVTTDVPVGPPPAGFTGPVEEPRFPDDTGEDDRADQLASMPAIQGFWQVDDQGRTYYVDDRGVRMSPAGVALDPEEERWGSTPAREPGTLPTNLPQQGSSMQDLANKERQEYFEEGANRPIGGTPGWNPFGTGEILSGGTAFNPPIEGLGLLPQELEELRLESNRGQQGLSMGDMFLKDFEDRLSYEPTGQAGASGWTRDTMPREGDPGFVGPVQPSGGALPSGAAGTASGALPEALPGASMSPDLESRVVDILDKVRDTYAYRDGPRSTTGLSRSDLQALVDAGLGKYDLSESQTIDQALASLKTGQYLEQNMPSIIGVLAGPVPQIMVESIFAMKEGYKPSSIVGTIVSSIIGSAIQMVTGIAVPGQAVQDLAQGNVGKAAFGVGVVNVAARLGLPVGTVNAALNGNLGAAAANQMLSEVVMESAKQMGADPGLVATVAIKSGVGQSAFEKIASAINDNSIVRSINEFAGEISSGIKGFGIDTGLGEAVTSREGALAAGDISGGYSGSYGGSGYESEQAGLIADAIQSGQPKKKPPRWSDLFFSNLARDMSISFAGSPPVDRGELDDLEESLNIADAYGDPSRRQDILDPLGTLEAGGDRLSVDLGGGDVETIGGAQDKTDIANIIREYAQLNDPSFVIYDDGTLGIRDYDLNVVHRFDGAGNVLGTYPVAHSGNERTSDVAKELLNTSYVSSLFGDRNEQITRRLAGTEQEDRMTEEEYRALIGSGQSANPPTAGTGQAVLGDVSGTFGSKADALAAFPGLSLVSKDTGTGDETYQNQGFTIIAKADGSVTATPKDQPTMTVELVAPTTVVPPPPDFSTAQPLPVVTPEDLVVSSPQGPTTPEQVTDQTQQQPTSEQPPVTQEPSTQPTTSLTTQDVQRIVQEALTSNPSLTQQQVQDIVNQAIQGLPPGLTSQDVSKAVSDAIAGLPQAPTAQDIDAAVSRAMTNVATQEDVRSAIAGIQFPAGITEADVTKAITDYMTANPGLSAQDVAGQVADQLSKLPTYATPADVQTAINGALTSVATKTDVANAIAGIQFPVGISSADVTKAITDYMAANPGLSSQDVAQQVADQLKTLPAYATPADVEAAIGSALTNVATKGDVAAAIAGIQFPAGITPEDVTNAITSYMQANPGLSAEDVADQVSDELAKLPSYATPADVTAAINGAMVDVATKADVANAIAGIQFPQGITAEDVTSAITEYMKANPGLSAADVAAQVAEQLATLPAFATPENVQGTVRDALDAYGVEAGAALDLVKRQLGESIQAAREAGAQGDQALQDGLDALASNLGTTKESLLAQLGTTEQALRQDFAAQLGGVQTELAGLGLSLSDAIANARKAGLEGDAALQAGLDALSGSLGTTKADLLAQLGTTEQALRAQFETALGGVQSALSEQLGGLRQETQGQYEALTAAQKAEVASRVQQGQGLANAIAEVQSGLSQQLGGLQQEVQAQYAALTAAQQAEVQNRISQGQDLSRAIAEVQSGLAGQIGGLQQGMQAQYEALTAAQQAEVQNRISQGQSLEAAINAVAAGVEQRLTDVQSGLTQQIGGVEERLGARVDELMEQGFDYQTATNQALKEVTGTIETLAEQQAQQGQQTQKSISDVEGRINQRVGELMQQGVDYQTATTTAIGEVRNSLSSLSEQTAASLSNLGSIFERSMQQSIDAQAASDLATLGWLQRLEAQQAAEAEAQRLAAEEEARKEEERAKLQLTLQQQQQMLSTASGFGAQGLRAGAGASDPYKATFKDPFIVGGEAKEFQSPLAGFIKGATNDGFLPSAQPSEAKADSDQTEYFNSGEAFGLKSPLEIYNPTVDYQGLYGFRQGGLVPAFAQGGTRHGNNAHGALRVLEHSGKLRADYRQGDAVTGIGDGQSDDIPAMLADGEFVIPADVVAALGNGSTKAGSDKLYEMMHNIRRHHRSAGPKDLPPPAKSPLEYIKPRRRAS